MLGWLGFSIRWLRKAHMLEMSIFEPSFGSDDYGARTFGPLSKRLHVVIFFNLY